MAQNPSTIQFGAKPLVAPTLPVASGAPKSIAFGSKPIAPVPVAPAQSSDPGLIDRLKSDFETRRKTLDEINQATVNGDQSGIEAFLQHAGQVIGGAIDIPTEAAKSVAKTILPQPVKNAIKTGVAAVGNVVNKIAEPIANKLSPADIYKQAGDMQNKAGDLYMQAHKETDLVKKASLLKDAKVAADTAHSMVDNGNDVDKSLARTARNVDAGINIGSILPVGEGAGIGAKGAGAVAEKAGTIIEKSGTDAAASASKKFAQDLVKPITSKAEKIAEVSRTTEKGIGPFKRSVVAPTPEEERMAQAISKVPGVSPKNTLQQNFNVIKSQNIINAGQLVSDVKLNNFGILHNETLGRLEAVKGVLSKSPVIVGDAEKTADKLLEGAKKFVKYNEQNGSGLLQARKDYDQWVLSQKPAAFDAKAENAFTTANREIRKVFNNTLDEFAPNAQVKDSLSHQSALYDAMENIAPKAAEEANTAIGRALQRIGKVLGTKNKIIQGIAAGVGIGGLGAAATFAPAVAGVGVPAYIIYRAGKLLMSPELRTGIGEVLKKYGDVLNPDDIKTLTSAVNNYGDTSAVGKEGSQLLKAPTQQLNSKTGEISYKTTVPKGTSKVKGAKGIITPGTVLGGAVLGAGATAFGTPEKTTFKAPISESTPTTLPTSTPELDSTKIGNILSQLESSGGTDKRSADPGEKKWLTGLTNVAIKELKRRNLLPANFNVNNEASVLKASAAYFNLMQQLHPDLTPAEVYVDHYWTQATSSKARQAKIDKFNELANGK